MVTEQVSLKNDIGNRIQNCAQKKFMRVLIPVSFSDLSYNALAYALKLVKGFNGAIDLFHVIDIAEVVESDNPIVVKRWLVKREKESANRIQSLSEMIGESHVTVSSSVVVTGDKRSCLLKQIREVCPDLIVLGKSSKVDNLVTFITENSSCPVLVVPFSKTLKLPSNVALATDRKSVTHTSLSSFLRIVQHTTQSFSLLRTQQENRGGPEKTQEIYIDGYDFSVRYTESESLVSYVTRNQIDLLCTIQRKQTFFKRFFQKRYALEMVKNLNIPVLILGEAP